MANDLEKALNTLPGWVIPVTIGGVVLVALFSKDNRGQSYTTAVYGPQPTDPGLISLAQTEIGARQSVYTTALNAFISRDIAAGENDRDVHLATIAGAIDQYRTRAAENVAIRGMSSNEALARIGAQSELALSRDRGATAKYVAKKENNPLNHVIDQVGNVLSKLNPFHW